MIEFSVLGVPVQQGNLIKSPQGRLYDTTVGLKPWRQEMIAAIMAAAPEAPIDAPVEVIATFTFQRPKSHYGTGRNAQTIKASAPHAPAGFPDLDKLQRALGDALKIGGMLSDDSRIVHWDAAKAYGATPGLFARIGILR